MNPSDVWSSPFIFYSQRRGAICNHATLLCSLLLGFGLDAYCAVGTNIQGKTHMFVVTRRKTAAGDYEVTFWEPSSAERFATNGGHPYATIGALFSHSSFYANVQGSDNAVTCNFDLENEMLWKPLNPLKLRMVPRFPSPPLLWIPMNPRAVELELEKAMQRAVAEHRENAGLQTMWDSAVSFTFAQALCGYEEQRTSGAAMDSAMFHQCVKGKLGEGRTFKGVPLNVTHISEVKIMSTFRSSATGKEILDITGDDLKHSIRVKCFLFPEGVVSVWVMLAAHYRAGPAP
jgi:centrosomal protein CEP76